MLCGEYPDGKSDISIVWAVSSTMGMGAIQAIEDMGMADKIDVYDFDCEADDVQAIKDGKLWCDTALSYAGMGGAGI